MKNPNYGKYKNYMTHNPPHIPGYEIVNTFKTKSEAQDELQDIKDHYSRGMIKPFYEGWVVYQILNPDSRFNPNKSEINSTKPKKQLYRHFTSGLLKGITIPETFHKKPMKIPQSRYGSGCEIKNPKFNISSLFPLVLIAGLGYVWWKNNK